MNYKTTKNTISIGTQIHDEKISQAKTYLKNQFGNKYDIDPHFNFVIMAMPEYRLKDVETLLDAYFGSKSAIHLDLGELHYEPKTKFFSIPIIGETVMVIHKELLDILNTIRDGYIRDKDLIRINEGRTDKEEEKYIKDYGYLRVLNKFMPHITIGNIQSTNEFDLDDVSKKLNAILGALYKQSISFNRVHAYFFEDADIQSDYKLFWEKDYILAEK